jgi:hypothetical protein
MTPRRSKERGLRDDLGDEVVPQVALGAARVTTIPVATDKSKAGICVTKPSPMVRRV